MFLIERKYFKDLFASQRRESGQLESRLDSQLSRLRRAREYAGRLLIVEAPDNHWKHDRKPDELADFELHAPELLFRRKLMQSAVFFNEST